MPPKKCGRCEKTVYPTEELKCLDKVGSSCGKKVVYKFGNPVCNMFIALISIRWNSMLIQ